MPCPIGSGTNTNATGAEISLLKPASGRGCERDGYIWLLLDNLGNEHLETIRIAFTTEQLDIGGSIAALVQRIIEPINRRAVGKSAVQNNNVALICRVQVKRPRPNRRAADQGDKFAAFQPIKLHDGSHPSAWAAQDTVFPGVSQQTCSALHTPRSAAGHFRPIRLVLPC